MVGDLKKYCGKNSSHCWKISRIIGDMTPIINYCFDSLSNPELGYPNLAKLNLSPDEFDDTWPRVVPVRLFGYFPSISMQHRSWLVDRAPPGSWYPIGLAWHDFDCDYFDLLKQNTKHRVRDGEIKLLFYYHEGDNPYRIKERFDHLCRQHGFPQNCYLFLSANSAAGKIENFMFMPEHELFFRYVNRYQEIPEIPLDPRKYQFTALNRTHKWWRATVMTDLTKSRILDNSLWSYNTLCDIGDWPEDNPLILDDLPIARHSIDQFVGSGPYFCDNEDSQSHNDHRRVNLDMFQQSYCHVVIETHFDADQSQGAFLTEKTYKCIKFGQPFVVVGTVNSLKMLREHGYRVFDDIIDNSYDEIKDNTQRWKAVKNTIAAIQKQNMHEWFLRCMPDLKHNQLHFLNSTARELENLAQRLHQLNTGTL
jgi:hypothetical protein